jgi:ketosteroid isomerase-like protein
MARVIPKDRRGKTMPARSPDDICRLFRQYMAEGDIDAVLSVYDPEAVFLNQSGEAKPGTEGLRQELAPFAARKASFEYDIKQVIEVGEIALMHTQNGCRTSGCSGARTAVSVIPVGVRVRAR